MSDQKKKEKMGLNKSDISQLKRIYKTQKKQIVSRLKEFEKLWLTGNDEKIFTELAFCLLTPQSKAQSCWEAVVNLKKNDLLVKGDVENIKHCIRCIRFKNKKAEYILKARELFMNDSRFSIKSFIRKFGNIYECREWLVHHIKGIGYKEASHFLRNIGFGEKLAILDRHILKNLKQLGVIKDIPQSMSRSKYLEIEKNMIKFAKKIDIPLSHLDLLFWSKETGEIFK
jgi:N-glycosylase/DNA lyase